MADTGKPADKSAQAQVRDSSMRDARPGDAQRTARPDHPAAESMTSANHPVSNEPLDRVQHADRAVPEEATTHRASPLSRKDQARFDELKSKDPNPNVLPPNVRTEDEEHEYRKLSKAVADYERQVALDAGRPEAQLTPKQRLAELKKMNQHGEGVAIETRRVEELIRDEERIAELQGMDKRVVEEDEELSMLQRRVADARANGGFAPNG